MRGWAVSALACGLIFVAAVACRAQSQSAEAIDWPGIESGYATWMKDPSRSNAIALERLLPRQHVPFVEDVEVKGWDAASEFIFAEEHFDFLIKKVRGWRRGGFCLCVQRS